MKKLTLLALLFISFLPFVAKSQCTPVSDTATQHGCGSLVFNGVTYTSSSVVTDTVRAVAGCDSVYHVTQLNVVNAVSQNITLHGCNSLVFNGIAYTSSTTASDTLFSQTGCDSVYINATITIDHLIAISNTTFLEGCGSVVFNGITYTSSIVLVDTIRAVNGCDSIYNITSIRVVRPVTQTTILRGCDSLIFRGIKYTNNAVIRDTIKSVLGCDSLYNGTFIRIQKVVPVYQNTSFSACRSVVYNGITYTVTTSVKDTLRSTFGCDSVYRTTTIMIQDIAPTIQTVFLADCDSVVFNGHTYTASTSTKDTIRSSFGCDSILINLNIRISGATTKDSVTLRGCDTVSYNGTIYSDSIILRDTIKTVFGCDSIYKIANIIVKHVVPVPESDTLFGCNTFTFNGVAYTDSAVVKDTLKTPEGCDSIYRTTYINIQKITPTLLDTTLKSCVSVTWDSTTYTTSTTFTDTLKTVLGCDSVLCTVHIVISSLTPLLHHDTLTGCNNVLFNGITYTASTAITDTIRTADLCDSLYNITHIVIKVNAVTQSNSFTSCTSIFYNGINYTSSAVVSDTIRTAAGCDSIYRVMNITIQNNPITIDTTITGCNSLVYNGITYTTSKTLRDTVRTAQYCDSIYHITHLVVKIITPVSSTNPLFGCNTLDFNGVTYTASATVLDTLKTPEGCDSIYRTNVITIQSITPVSTTITRYGCVSLLYNGVTYTTSVTLMDTIRTVGGCDSLYHITDIQIVTPVAENNTVTGCHGSVVFNGITYTASTIVLDTLKSVFGCDSIYRTNDIHVENIVAITHTTNLSGCGSVVYNGFTYTAPTVLIDTLKSAGGCDSIYNKTIISIVITPVLNAVTLNGCGSLVFQGITYTSSTIINDTLRTSGGCDSIYNVTTINVQNITPAIVSNIVRGCSGSVVFNGITYTASVVLKDTIRTSIGCDSIYTTNNIIVENITPVTHTASLSDCQSIVFNGVTYTTSTVVNDTLKTNGGCDSLYNITNININASVTNAVTLSGCDSVIFKGITYTNSLVINDTIRSRSGCDSVYNITNINVQHITPKWEASTIAGCNTLTINGITYTNSTVLHDTLISMGGCDSVFVTTNIIVQHITATSTSQSLHGCGSLLFNGITYTSSTVVLDTLKSIGGCDSIYTTISISIVTPVAVINNLQGCNSLVFHGITYTASTVIKDTVKSVTGCDSLYNTTNINIQHITPVPGYNQVAGCGSVTFNGVTYTASQIVQDTLKTTLGCDSIYRTNNIIVQNVTPVSVTVTLQGCGSLTYSGITYTASTVISDTVKSIGGCDSLYQTVNIVIVNPVAVTNNLQGCNSIVFNGITYTNNAVVHDTTKSVTGCDSLYITTNINIQHITPVPGYNQVAGCGSVTFNGVTYTASQIVHDTLKTTLGCDSIYRTNNIIVQNITPVSLTVTLQGCGSLTYSGITYTTSTVISDTVKSIGHCDSLYRTVNIVIVNPVAVTNNLQGCNSLIFNGITYTNNAVVHDTTKSMIGCDSLYITTNINIQHITAGAGYNQVAGCNSVTFNGVTYTANAVVHDTLKTTLGCDSIYRTNNIIVQNVIPVAISVTLQGCGSLTYSGVTYTASTVINDTVKSIGGCDSLYQTVNIVIVNPVAVTNNLQGCNSLVFNGITYTNNAVVHDTTKSMIGCDSLYITTSINIQHITPVPGYNQVAGCGSVVFNGITYTANAIVHDTLKTTLGCDSIYRTNNIIVQNITPVAVTQTLEGCGSLVYNGITYTSSTVVRDTTKSIGGCDSLYNTTYIKIVVPVTVIAKLHGCNSLVFNGITYTVTTVVNDTIHTVKGCDSVYNVTFISIQNITPVPGNNTVKGCNSVFFNGITYTANSVVLDTLKTTQGCDSIFRTNYIMIQNITPVTNSVSLSGCRSVFFNGTDYTVSTVVNDTTRSSYGCDSIYNVTTITVNNLALSLSASQNPVIIGNNITLSTSASVAYTVTEWMPSYLFAAQTAMSQNLKADSTRNISVVGISAAGCKDTATLHLVVNYLDQVFIPNSFTPNGDGKNDEFRVYGNNISKVELMVFNQWGQKLFEAHDQYQGWSGHFGGQTQPTGVYVYAAKITLNDGSVINKKGSLNLVR